MFRKMNHEPPMAQIQNRLQVNKKNSQENIREKMLDNECF